MLKNRALWLALALLVVSALAGLWFSLRPLITAEPSRPVAYVGGEACAECHATQTKLWRESHHDLAMQVADDKTILGDFKNTQFTYAGVTSIFFKRGREFYVTTDGPDGKLYDYKIKYTFGVTPLQQYLIEFPGGRLQALSIAWDSRPKDQGGQRWFHLYPDQKITHGDPLHWTGSQQNWNFMCVECHSTNVKKNYDSAARQFRTTFSEIDVSCEACHGPGADHVKWAERPRWLRYLFNENTGLAINLDERRGVSWNINPETGTAKRSVPRQSTREIETCARCHARRAQIWEDYRHGKPLGDTHRVALLEDRLYFPDGQIRDEVYVYGSFVQSRMYHQGVTCGDCHEPHSLTLRAPANALCAQCHSADKYASSRHHFHASESRGAECVACHMPARTYMVVDPRRDHSLRVPRPDLSATLGVPNACNQCHTNRSAQWSVDQMRRWYGHQPSGFQRFAEALHAGDLAAPGAREALLKLAKDRDQPAIARASALARLDRVVSRENFNALNALLWDPDPLVRRAAVAAHRMVPIPARMPVLELLADPVRDVRLEAAVVVGTIPEIQLNSTDRAARAKVVAEYIDSQNFNADRPEALLNLGLLYANLRRRADAEGALKRALELDPAFVPAAVNLADLYRATGRDNEGEAALRNVLRHDPASGAARHALGLVLVRGHSTAEAISELEQAARLEPQVAQYGYVYAVALESTGRLFAAIRMLESLLQRHPNHRDSLTALAQYELKAGRRDKARRYADRLVRLEPQDPGARELRALVEGRR